MFVDLESPVARDVVRVEKIAGGFAVANHRDEYVVAYKNKKHATNYAEGEFLMMWNGAEDENARRDAIAAYLAERAARPVKEKAQMELF